LSKISTGRYKKKLYFWRTAEIADGLLKHPTCCVIHIFMSSPKSHITNKDPLVASALPGNSIAILPFVNMSADSENEYFSDGITEEIINAMTKVEGLKVTARTSSFVFKNVKLDVQEIGRQLNVATLLEGSVRVAGNKVRITAQLINVEDGFHFWSETFDRELEDIFGVQEEVSLLIAEKLREHTGHFEIADHLVDTPVIPVETYKLYLKGRHLIRKMNQLAIKEGIATLQKVIERQADYTLAYLDIHYAYTYLIAIGALPAQAASASARPYLEMAIKMDPDLPECHLHLASIRFWEHWDYENAYQHLIKALALRPSYMDAHQLLAFMLSSLGKFDAAEQYIETALQLDPFSPINQYYKGAIYYQQEQYPEAVHHFKKTLSLEPHFTFAYLLMGGSLILMGRAEEALALFKNMPPAGEADLSSLGGQTLAHAVLKNEQQTEYGIVQLRQKLQSDLMGRALFFLILIYTASGKYEEALNLLEEGVKHRVPTLILIEYEPLLKPLRPLKRFQKALKVILGEPADFALPSKKYQTSTLKEEDMKVYSQRLERCMSEEKPYLDPQLSLKDLAEKMELSPNHLSQLLNEKMGQNFAEFVNSYRLEEFKARVVAPAHQHLTILALAMDSGFSSKTVFNTFFKKKMGITPRKYWKEQMD
jgi:adenylate cyclase